MRKQEGKCHFKPAPENTIEVTTEIKGPDLTKMDQESKDDFKEGVQEITAEAAGEEKEAVEVTLTDPRSTTNASDSGQATTATTAATATTATTAAAAPTTTAAATTAALAT